jgi:hypothetical protein
VQELDEADEVHRLLPPRKMLVIRAIWSWMWSFESPSRLVPRSQL